MFNQLIKLKINGRGGIVHPTMVTVTQGCNAFIVQIFTQEFELRNIVPLR
jgi:hypothetical protein